MKLLHLLTIGVLSASFILCIVSLGGTAVPWGHMSFQYLEACSSNSSCGYPDAYCDTVNGFCRETVTGTPTRSIAYLLLNLGLTEWSYCAGAFHGDFDKDQCVTGANCDACATNDASIKGLMIFGIIVSTLSSIIVVIRAKSGSCDYFIYVGIIGAMGLYFGAWMTWLRGCHEDMKKTLFIINPPTTYPGRWNLDAGFWLTFAAFVSTLLFGIFQLIVSLAGPRPTAEQPAGSVAMDETPRETQQEVPASTEGLEGAADEDRPPRQSLPAAPAPRPQNGPNSFVPTRLSKAMHLLSLAMIIWAVVSAIVAIGTKSLAWTSYDESWEDTYGFPNNNPDEPNAHIQVNAKLGDWDFCQQDAHHPYSAAEGDPKSCYDGGRIAMILVALTIVINVITVVVVLARARGYWREGGAAKGVTSFLLLSAFGLLVGAWASWVSKAGCVDDLEQMINDQWAPFAVADIKPAAGFGVAVTAWVCTFFGLLFQAILAFRDKSPSQQGVTGEMEKDLQYTALVDADVPYL